LATHRPAAASHTCEASSQHSPALRVLQQTVPGRQHDAPPATAGSPATQHVASASQQKARLLPPTPSPQHCWFRTHRADPMFHRQHLSVLAVGVQCGVSVPAPQHCSVLASQFTPNVVPNGPGQLNGFAAAGTAVTGADDGAVGLDGPEGALGAVGASVGPEGALGAVGASVGTAGAAVAPDLATHRPFAASHTCVASSQHSPALRVLQQTVPRAQHVAAPEMLASPAVQHVESVSQQKARLPSPTPSPQHVCPGWHVAEPWFHRQHPLAPPIGLQCGV
jgi:hypothetical protein